MSTTIRLSSELKQRVALAAKRSGTSAHNFILEAVAMRTESDEKQAVFLALAEAREREFARTGRTVPLQAMADYLGARLDGAKPARPRARTR